MTPPHPGTPPADTPPTGTPGTPPKTGHGEDTPCPELTYNYPPGSTTPTGVEGDHSNSPPPGTPPTNSPTPPSTGSGHSPPGTPSSPPADTPGSPPDGTPGSPPAGTPPAGTPGTPPAGTPPAGTPAVPMSMHKITYSALIMKIKSEEVRHRDRDEEEEQMTMFTKKKHQDTKKDKKLVKCFGCGKLGHYKNEWLSKNKKPHEENVELHVAFHSNTKRLNGDRAMWGIDSVIRVVLVAVGNPVPVNEYKPIDGREYPLGTEVGVAKQVISHE
ncbi:uncharacterized protein PHALS_13808 [Plasmopara halstedii]|uniref:Uncharacterized protein n=1 Tax=Plasmopara halstedii TaxID=4781 RepID=A0A0P1AQV2_PLAHL|nr:uncharacterized protein PHALS_13808 [Plasmopara halstedii]CEG43617.1 hypothetical protein PHALS_13808 [Plasmopara halstedii]|eukprot:XP_024579986.1 hypothetical protein PHALS_13808 [Plasmopara halstedii]